MRPPHHTNRIWTLSTSAFATALSLCAGVVYAQDAGANPLEEFQRRVALCEKTEEWLKDSCLQEVYDFIAPKDPQPVAKPTTPPSNSADTAQEPPKAEPVVFSELHMISIYEGPITQNTDGSLIRGRVPVRVDRPGETVALALSSHIPVTWDVVTSPGTTIARVAVSGETVERTVVMVDNERFTPEVFRAEHVVKANAPNFHHYYKAVQRAFDANRGESFNGAYKAPKGGFLIATAPGVPTLAEENTELRAQSVEAAELSPAFQTAMRAKQNYTVVFVENGFQGVMANGESVRVPLPIDMPEVSWPAGAAYDMAGGRLWGAASGGIGVLYTYNIATKAWKAYPMENVDVGGIHYDAQTDSLLATPGPFNTGFSRLDTTGKVLESYDIRETAFPGLERFYDRGNGPAPTMVPMAYENGLLLVRPEARFNRAEGNMEGVHYLVDLKKQTVLLVR